MPDTKLLVVLQNPWARGRLRAGYNPSTWRREFEASRSGRRLALAIPTPREWQVHYANACPRLADHVDGHFDFDEAHMRRAIKRVSPDIMLACGVSAETACRTLWKGPLVCVPHPASRVLTNELYAAAEQVLTNWGVLRRNPGWRGEFNTNPLALAAEVGRIALRQRRGRYEIEHL